MKNNIEVRIQQTLVSVFPSIDVEFKQEWGPNEIEGWDSMGHINLVMAINEEFDVSLDFDEVMTIQTVGDVISILQKKGLDETSN
jgi:acyl carrier protein